MKINTKKLKASLSLEDHKTIMKALNIPIFTEDSKTIAYWTGDKNVDAYKGSPGKLVFYKDTKIYIGYTSGSTYDIISLVQRRLSLLKQKHSFQDAINFITSTVNIGLESVKRINKPHICNWEDEYEKFIRFRQTGSMLKPYDDKILEQLDPYVPQGWIDEGISLESMEKYQIGYYRSKDQTTIPCFNRQGELIGIRVRNWQKEAEAKYMPLILLDGTCYKFPTNQVFYGINYNWYNIEQSQTVVLVEGEKSVLKADTFFSEKSNVLALYGNQLGLARRNELVRMGVKQVILALDSDFKTAENSDDEFNKFVDKMWSIAKLFKGFCKVDCIYNNIGLNGYKCSPFDFDKETYDKLYQHKENMI